MTRVAFGIVVLVSLLTASLPALAQPVAVRFAEGVGRGFPVIRAATGERLAQGDVMQFPRGDRLDNRMVFRFRDGSVYDERVVFSQDGVFTVHAYSLVQRGPSFPEGIDAHIDRDTGRYRVRHQAEADGPEEVFEGRIELPPDVYNGLLTTLMKNLSPGVSARVKVVAFTPTPRLVTMVLAAAAEEEVAVGEMALPATRSPSLPALRGPAVLHGPGLADRAELTRTCDGPGRSAPARPLTRRV
jgi:hypothetical protein